jgi:hypothetical protein
MPPGSLPYVVLTVCLLANGIAALALVAGRRAERPRRLAARSGIALLAIVVVAIVGYLGMMTRSFMEIGRTDPAQKAAVLARAISEVMNIMGFTVLASVLPLGVTIYLLVKRAPPNAG